jgi:hypothetical protein
LAGFPEDAATNRRNDSDPTGTVGRSYPMAQWVLPVVTSGDNTKSVEKYAVQLLLSLPTNTNDTGTQQTLTTTVENYSRLGTIANTILKNLRSLTRVQIPVWIEGTMNSQTFTQRDADGLDQLLLQFTLVAKSTCKLLTPAEVADLLNLLPISSTDDNEVLQAEE